MTNSPLRWAGSKRSLMPQIRRARPSTVGHYIEPFVGSACVFFDTNPVTAHLSDFNGDLVQFFTELRDNPRRLYEAFAALDPSGGDYYMVRSQTPSLLSSADRAARFLYLNRFAFNGVYRTNRDGHFNVPRGARTGALPSQEDLQVASDRLAAVSIECTDYLVATAKATAGDFVYLDPPYRNQSRPTFGEYGYESFGSEDDVKNLGKELRRLTSIGARVLLSFNDDVELGEALDGWCVIRIERRRSVAGTAKSRTSLQGEILAMNYARGAHLA